MLCLPRDKGQCRPPAPSWCTPRSPQSAGRTKTAIRGIHYMHLHLSELKKNRERPCSPLGSGLLGEIRQLRPSPSTYRGETEVSGGGIHGLLFLFSLKATDKSSCYIHRFCQAHGLLGHRPHLSVSTASYCSHETNSANRRDLKATSLKGGLSSTLLPSCYWKTEMSADSQSQTVT